MRADRFPSFSITVLWRCNSHMGKECVHIAIDVPRLNRRAAVFQHAGSAIEQTVCLAISPDLSRERSNCSVEKNFILYRVLSLKENIYNYCSL